MDVAAGAAKKVEEHYGAPSGSSPKASSSDEMSASEQLGGLPGGEVAAAHGAEVHHEAEHHGVTRLALHELDMIEEVRRGPWGLWGRQMPQRPPAASLRRGSTAAGSCGTP